MTKLNGNSANLSSDKLLQIFEYMASRRLPVRLKDISTDLNISQPTVVRYLRTLRNQAYVYHDDRTGCYAMTWKICRLSSSLESNLVLRNMAGSLLNDFANQYNLGVLLAVERNDSLVYLDLVDPPHGSANAMLRIGNDAPIHSTASGKILLSAMTEARANQILDQQGQVRLTANTITNRQALMQELAKIQQQGYALDNEECEIGHRCVSVPVYDYTGTVAAAISAYSDTSILTDELIQNTALPALKALSQEVSFRMGHSVSTAQEGTG